MLKVKSLFLFVLFFSSVLFAWEEPASQIIKGQKDIPNYYSYVFSIDHCTAFLVHPKVLLTAAHCITSSMKRSKYLNLSNRTKAKNNKRIKLNGPILVHPKYHYAKYHDMAVIISEENIKEKFQVKYIPEIFWGKPKLWQQIDKENPYVTAVGYGETNRGVSGTKRSVSLKFQSLYFDIKNKDLDMLQHWRMSDFTEGSILPTAFTLSNSPADTCNGDSGGPVIMNEITGKKLLGITMGGAKKCGSGKSPSAYRMIAPDICWFKSSLKYYLGNKIIEYCQ